MSSRDTMLAAIRAQLPPGREPPLQPPALPGIGDVSLSTAGRLAMFAQRLQAVGAELHIASAQAPASTILSALLQPFAGARVGWSNASELQGWMPDLAKAVRFELVAADRPVAELLQCTVGVTAAQWGIAASGTLVLLGSAERHRLLSLLPPIHIAVLPASRLLATIGEALKLLPRPMPGAVTFVTGPSRTADIELQLVVGVHGPRQLHVVVL